MKETKLRFFRFTPCEDGYMAHMETTGGINIPVNVYADPGTDFFLHAGQRCSFPLRGIASVQTAEVYPDAERYYGAGHTLLIPGLIPTGTFSPKEDGGNFEQSPHVLLTGTVTGAERRSPDAGPGPDWLLEVETLDMTVYVYMDHEGEIVPGNILHCAAWLFGDIAR